MVLFRRRTVKRSEQIILKVFYMALEVKSLEGNEIYDDYTRKAQQRGRWGETWDVFKGNFGKVVLINLFVLLFCAPAIAVFFVRSVYINALGIQLPFNANTGMVIHAFPGLAGLTERVYLSSDLLFYSVFVVAGFIASVGIAGGAYSLKKLVNTRGEFSFKGFFHGVKVCYFNVLFPVTLFLLFFFACVIVGDWKDIVIAEGGSGAGPTTAYAFIIIATILVGLYCAWLLATGVSYRLKFTQLLKNAFVLMIGSPVHTIFMAGFALIPVWIYLIGMAASLFTIIAYILFVLFGFSFIIMVWMSFTQWVFDLYVTPNFKKASDEAKAKKSPKELAEEQEADDKRIARELLAAGRSELIGRPILPISEEEQFKPLGFTYSRNDLKRISDEKAKLDADIKEYENAHSSDRVYAEYNKLFAEREKALQSDGKKGKKKKVSSDNLLK